ncbi:MAG TPA: PRC-barrel domain-containing protein [Acidimicrobiia bacterium]|nr:PRC-barrel domain-containing protein [Acidimicrobiia bacterium]
MTVTSLSAGTITGDKARNHDGDDLGHLEELVIDLEGGRVNYAVLASGGFLGLGEKYFAIPWDLLTVDTDSHEVVIDVSKEMLENAPGFDKDNWPDIQDRSWVEDVYRYYGRDPYWDETPPLT